MFIPCGGGIEYLHRTPASLKGNPMPGGYKYGDLALQVGGFSRIGTIKYGLDSRGTALARTSSNNKFQTRALVR
jgi:hypothetical protein